MEKIVSFPEDDKPLSQEDIAKLESLLGYRIEVPASFFDEPDVDRHFDGLMEVLANQHKAITIDALHSTADDFFYQLTPAYPELGIKLVRANKEESSAVEQIEFEIGGQMMTGEIDWTEGPGLLVGILNETLLDKTRTQLVTYGAGHDVHDWFVAKDTFSGDEFNAILSGQNSTPV